MWATLDANVGSIIVTYLLSHGKRCVGCDQVLVWECCNSDLRNFAMVCRIWHMIYKRALVNNLQRLSFCDTPVQCVEAYIRRIPKPPAGILWFPYHKDPAYMTSRLRLAWCDED